MLSITVDQLIDDVLAVDNTPISQITFSKTQIAKFMDEEMRNAVVPLFTRIREEYFVITASYDVDTQTKRISIPPQAAGFRLRDIYLYDQNDNFVSKLNRINPDNIPYMGGAGVITGGYMLPTYYIENNDVVFYPSLPGQFKCKIRYFKAPNHLYPYAACTARVMTLLGGGQVQVDQAPTGSTAVVDWVANYSTTKLDVIKADTPYNFRFYSNSSLPILAEPIIAPVVSNVVTLSANAYNSIQVGDYLCTSDTCGFVQFMPFEAYQLIKYRASMRVLKAQGDPQNLAITAQLYNAAADDLQSLLAPKVENMPKKVRPGGLIGRGSRGRW
jgi:hypothetical protein